VKSGRDWGQTTKLENPGLGAIFPACSRDCAGGTDNQARKPFRAIEAKKRERQQSEARREREKQFNRKVELNAAMGWVHAELNQTLS
jgi:hypothetical protein